MGKITVTPCDVEGLFMLLNQRYLKDEEDIS